MVVLNDDREVQVKNISENFESLFGKHSKVTSNFKEMLINLVNRSLTESESNSGINGWVDDECPASPIEKPFMPNYPSENWDSDASKDLPGKNGMAELRRNPIYAGPQGHLNGGTSGADQYDGNGMARNRPTENPTDDSDDSVILIDDERPSKRDWSQEFDKENSKVLTVDDPNAQIAQESPAKRAKNFESSKKNCGGVLNFAAESCDHQFNFELPKPPKPPTPWKEGKSRICAGLYQKQDVRDSGVSEDFLQAPQRNSENLKNPGLFKDWDDQTVPNSVKLADLHLKAKTELFPDTSTPKLEFKEPAPVKPAIKKTRGRKLGASLNAPKNIPKICRFPLLGDDFFLRMMTQSSEAAGMCKSGLTIRDAGELLYNREFDDKIIVVNIGNEDIIRDHRLLDMIEDYTIFIMECKARGVTPILTTLAPIPNLDTKQKEKLMMLNGWIRKHNHIDIFPCMLNSRMETQLEMYHQRKSYVAGSRRPRRFWNSNGEARVLNKLRNSLTGYIVQGQD